MNTRLNISSLQLFVLYVNIAFGIGIMSLPRVAGMVAREDLWLSVPIGGSVLAFLLWCTIALSRQFPGVTAIEYHRALLGPLLGNILNIFYMCTMLVLGAMMLRMFALILKLFLFDLTPSFIFVIVILTVAAYIGQYGLEPLIRFQQFLVIMITPIFIPLILLGLLRVELHHFQPFLAEGILPVLKGGFESWAAFSGPELITGLLFPFITRKNQAVKIGMASVLVITAVYTLTIVIVQGVLGVSEIVTMRFPTVMAYREVEIPDTFIERLDGYVLVFWIAIFAVSFSNLCYFAAFACARLLKLEYSRPCIVLLIPIYYFIVYCRKQLLNYNY